MNPFLPMLLLPLMALQACADESKFILIKSFFRDNGQNGVYLAASEDGLVFTPLNDDKPVMKPAPWDKQNLTRDPSIIFHEGIFHMVWTTSWSGDCFAYAESKDLKQWSEPVRVEPFKGRQKPQNTWAPEICYDPHQKNFMIFWSSVVPPAGQQIFLTRTKLFVWEIVVGERCLARARRSTDDDGTRKHIGKER